MIEAPEYKMNKFKYSRGAEYNLIGYQALMENDEYVSVLDLSSFIHAKLIKVCLKYSITPLRYVGQATIDCFIRKLISKHDLEDNFYVCDLGQVARCYSAWRRALPRVNAFFAVKCHPNPAILSILAAMGSGFDCASAGEIEMVLGHGVSPNRIIYANPCKKASDLRYARKVGVRIATFDTVSELDKVAINNPRMLMVLRIRADDPSARCQLGNKFGAEPETWKKLLNAAKQKGITVIGVSFHVGSGASSTNAFNQAIASVRSVFDIGISLGFAMNLVDIGGGFTASLNENRHATLNRTANAINRALEHFFPVTAGYTIIAEPGRYMVENACTMVSQIFGRRLRYRSNGQKDIHYWITDGLYGSMNCVIYDHASLKPYPLKYNQDSEETYTTTLFGPTCDGLDTVARDIMLPEMKNGDWIGFHDMGAYTIAGAADFNSIKVSSVKFWYIFTN